MSALTDKDIKRNLKEDTRRLKEWLLHQPHLPHQDVDDELLIAFANGAGSLEIAKQKLDYFCTLRTEHPNLFGLAIRKYLLEEIRNINTSLKLFIPPNTTTEGWRVVYIKFYNSKFERLHLDALLVMSLELVMVLWPETKGIAFAVDLAEVDTGIVTKINFTQNATSYFVQNAMPMRFKRGVYFNGPQYIFAPCNLALKALKEKIRQRLVITDKGAAVLQEHFPLSVIPSDYGGEDKSLDELNDYWVQILKQHCEILFKNSSLCADESKRPPDTLNTYGVDGTFRSLGFD